MYARLFGGTNEGQEVWVEPDWHHVNVMKRERRPVLRSFADTPPDPNELRFTIEQYELHWAFYNQRAVCKFGVFCSGDKFSEQYLDECAEETIRPRHRGRR